jgi:hypothetical protein
MKINRLQPQKRINTLALACGCLGGMVVIGFALVAVVLLLIVPTAVQDTALQSAGFEPLGDTDEVFNSTSQPPPQLETVEEAAPPEVVIQAGSYGEQTIDNTGTYDVQVGTINGQSAMQMTFNEQDLLNLCQQYSESCTATGERIRNVHFDLRPGGMVVYGDVYIAQVSLWQTVGVVMRFTADNRLAVNGVDINGQLYAAPPNEIGGTITEIETIANDVLQQLTVQAGMETYALQSIYSDDNVLMFTMV